MYLIIVLYALCASMFTISKWGLAYTEPIFFVAVRMILAGTLLCGYLIARHGVSRAFFTYVKQDWFLFAQVIFFHIYLTYLCDLCALKDISSVESAVIYNLSPFIAALLSYFWFNELMTPKKWLGLLIGFAAYLPHLLQTGPLTASLWPRFLTLIAVISSAYGWVLLRALMKKGYSPLVANGIGMFFGGLIALLTSYIAEPWAPSPVTCWVPFIQATILIVVVANLLFYNLYGYLLKHYTATYLSFAGFMCPPFAAFLGYMFLGETFSPSLLISFVAVCIGLFIFYHEELRQGYVN
jgi:drug/metabolite transporter (DMT)-like permease